MSLCGSRSGRPGRTGRPDQTSQTSQTGPFDKEQGGVRLGIQGAAQWKRRSLGKTDGWPSLSCGTEYRLRASHCGPGFFLLCRTPSFQAERPEGVSQVIPERGVDVSDTIHYTQPNSPGQSGGANTMRERTRHPPFFALFIFPSLGPPQNPDAVCCLLLSAA